MKRFQFDLKLLGLALCVSGIAACGGGGGGDRSDEGRQASTSKESGVCGDTSGAINQAALEDADCKYLSSYRLFADASNPTENPNGRGVIYDLTTPLFSDYASKYRFVFVPDAEAAAYNEHEVFDFPVGTVLVKTFSMPADTAFRGFDANAQDERLIETRLLIHREKGWVGLPYVWNDDFSDAELQIAGGVVPVTTVHNGVQLDIDYRVPDKNQCKQCHQYKASGSDVSAISPIGPKARLLNRSLDYASGSENELSHWISKGILTGVPSDLNTIQTVPSYHDSDASLLAGKSDEELMQLAKGYLDINCSHCHRPEGSASNTGLHMEFWRDFDTNLTKHGVCKKPIAFGGGALAYDVVPGDAENSILHYRMSSTEPGELMPELGRTVVHEEGLELIGKWINSMTPDSCD
ncbi:SO2930 family diheme c-type cytochrome [Marinobacter mangrovi]|uniref:SO2930 family diheme c-type cytochrome n=1 Tax=Marinobacter mangrovi TaxID=2803918 RepID=UPI0019330685|nr:SO2930 family diheme c-type cytochrome [Marinobacter mangrovi]